MVDSVSHFVPQFQPYQNQVSGTCSTNTYTSESHESGFSSAENLSTDDQALYLPQSFPLEASVEVKPSKGPIEGGGVFQLKFDQSLPNTVTSAWVEFGNKQVEVWKTYERSFILHGESIPAGDVPGKVTVTITTKNGDYLGKTLFTYVDQTKENLTQIIKSRKLQGEFFTMLGKQCESDESEENNSRTFGLPSDGRQRQAMGLLRCLVYTAAGIGAEEFLRMIFSTSTGRIVFEAYKKESPLPEDLADANGHEGTATFLRTITKRFSEEDTSQMQSGINWHNLARAVEESKEQSVSWSSEKHVKQLKENDLSERQYFGDAETSSTDSEEERRHYKDHFEERFSRDQDIDPIQMGLDPKHQMTEKDIHDHQLPEKIGGDSSILCGLTEYEIHHLHLPDDIGTRWKDLARELGFNQACITATESDKDCNKESCIALLVKWMEREGQQGATREKLATALTNIGLQNLADKLIGPLNKRLTIPIEVEKTITLDDAHQELDNSVNPTIQITVNTAEETKIMKTSDAKELDISDELKCLQEKLSDITSALNKGKLKEESFPITNRLDLLDRHSRILQELYTKVTGMTGEARKCDELVRRSFYDFTYHSLKSVHNDLCARAADLQSAEPTMREKERETLKRLLSYQRGREKQVVQLDKLWMGLFSPMRKAYLKDVLNKEITTPKSGVQIWKSLSFSEGNLTKVKTRQKYEFAGLIKRKSDGVGPVLVKFSEAGEET